MHADRFIQLCGSDEPLSDTLVIDGHCHVGQWIGMHTIERDIEGIMEVADAVGIDRLCINYAACPEMRLGNDLVADCMRRYPGRIEGVCYVNFFEGGEQVQRAELTRCFDELGFRGVKIIDMRGSFYPQTRDWFEEDDPLRPTWEFAQERGAGILCHGYLTYELARRYPGANFIVAHGSGVPAFMLKLVDVQNVYCDMSATSMLAGTLELLCEAMGPERVLYGSDLPASDPGQRLGMVMAAKISEAAKTLILGRNMQGLLDNVS